MQVGAEPQFLYSFSAIPGGPPILCSGNRLFGQRAQPSGLRPLPALFHSELSHSLVNMAQWLTASTVSMSCRHGSEHGSKQQHVEPVCVDHVLAGGPLKDREAPVLRCHERNGIALILDELGCR